MIDFVLERNSPNRNILYIETSLLHKNTVLVLTDEEVTNLMVLCKEYYKESIRSVK